MSERHKYSVKERLLLIVALFLGIAFDRIFVVSGFEFWLCFLVTFYAFYWKKLRKDFVSWFLAGCSAALCIWSFFFSHIPYISSLAFLNFLVIPGVLMGLVIYTTGDFHLKDTGNIAIAWLMGFFAKPFTAIPHFFLAIGALLGNKDKSKSKRIVIGAVISIVLLAILLPLLGSADRAFGYHLEQIFINFDVAAFIFHSIIIFLACILFYSFLWNVGFGEKVKALKKTTARIDGLIGCIVLGSITLLYITFCVVQFSYLFAGAGLPGGMTYSEYARHGFSQTVVVCSLNMLIFGVFQHYGKNSPINKGLLIGLLVLTAVMLFSGFIRLGLYIDAYGMTWLRLLSAWYYIYMGVVTIMCGVRLWLKKLPLISTCALILVGWYIVLGYVNAFGFIPWYNAL